MKVLWLCSWYPHSKDVFDGDFVERHARSLATIQKLDVIHVVQNMNLLQQGNSNIEERREHNINVKICFVSSSKRNHEKVSALIFNIRYYQALWRLLREYLVQNGAPDIVHVHVPVKMGAGAIWLKKKFNIPFIVTEHSTSYFHQSHDNYFDRGFFYRYLTKKTFNNADAVTSVSKCLMNVMGDLFHLKQKHVIRNSVNTALFFPIETSNSVYRFVHVSMMVPFKNIEGILNALACLVERSRKWEMIFVGPATDRQISLAKELEIDTQIIWKGALSYEEVAREMQNADALIHFSNYENLPCVISEALCCGVPVISSDVGGISEFIDETNGILVEPQDIGALVNAMDYFLQHHGQFDKKEISESATSQFNYKVIGLQIANVYSEVLSKK